MKKLIQKLKARKEKKLKKQIALSLLSNPNHSPNHETMILICEIYKCITLEAKWER